MQGFRLTQEAKDEGFCGGSIKATDAGHTFDIGQALTEEGAVNPDKVFYVDDDLLGEVLASYPALERIPAEEVPGDAEVIPSPRVPLVMADTLPYTPQTNDVREPEPMAEIMAEHADEPATEEEAVAVGESVSGPSVQSPVGALQAASTYIAPGESSSETHEE